MRTLILFAAALPVCATTIAGVTGTLGYSSANAYYFDLSGPEVTLTFHSPDAPGSLGGYRQGSIANVDLTVFTYSPRWAGFGYSAVNGVTADLLRGSLRLTGSVFIPVEPVPERRIQVSLPVAIQGDIAGYDCPGACSFSEEFRVALNGMGILNLGGVSVGSVMVILGIHSTFEGTVEINDSALPTAMLASTVLHTPEPATMALFGTGLLVLVARRIHLSSR